MATETNPKKAATRQSRGRCFNRTFPNSTKRTPTKITFHDQQPPPHIFQKNQEFRKRGLKNPPVIFSETIKQLHPIKTSKTDILSMTAHTIPHPHNPPDAPFQHIERNKKA